MVEFLKVKGKENVIIYFKIFQLIVINCFNTNTLCLLNLKGETKSVEKEKESLF